MMKLEDQCVSLELAKKLKELGVKQNSLFVWEYYDEHCYGIKYIPYAVVPTDNNRYHLYSAFTVSELGEMLPINIKYEKRNSGGTVYWYADNWDLEEEKQFLPAEIKEADARAEMLIHLIENKLIDISADNK